MNMILIALALFALAAVLGLIVATALFRRRPTPKPVVVTHGLVGAAGLVVLILYALQQPHKLLTVAIALLIVGALGGFLLVANDLRGKPGPLPLVVVHAFVAVVSVVLVALVAF